MAHTKIDHKCCKDVVKSDFLLANPFIARGYSSHKNLKRGGMEFLLPMHIVAGTIALFCAAMSVLSEKGKQVHVLSGRTYF